MGRRNRKKVHPAILMRSADSPASWPVLSFDGSCEGNGRRDATGRWGWLLTDPDGTVIRQQSGYVVASVVTNNVAEWVGLRNGLLSLERSKSGVLIQGDSMLVIRTLLGEWESRAPMLTLYREECWAILEALERPWAAEWIPRESNHMADALTR